MALRATNENDVTLVRRGCVVIQLIQAVFTVFLLMETVTAATHLLAAGLTLLSVVLIRFGWAHRLCRVLTRLLTVIPVLLLALFVTIAVALRHDTLGLGDQLMFMCSTGGVMLSYFTVGTSLAGMKGCLYDKLIACFTATFLAVTVAIATLSKTMRYELLWSWDNDIVRYVWLGMVVAAAVMAWLASWLRAKDVKPET